MAWIRKHALLEGSRNLPPLPTPRPYTAQEASIYRLGPLSQHEVRTSMAPLIHMFTPLPVTVRAL